jgi:hypothetical protein
MLTFKHYFHEKIRGSTFQALERLAESELASDIERLLGPVVSKKAFDVPRKPPESKLTVHSNQCDMSCTCIPSATFRNWATSKSA